MDDTETMEDVKPSTNIPHIFDTQDARSEMLLGYKDSPIKMGEIFRNNREQYSFVCFYCGLMFDDFGEIINHCENHYPDEKFDVDVQPSEFVCGEMECEPLPITTSLSVVTLTEPIIMPNKSASLIHNSKAVIQPQKSEREHKRERKRKHQREHQPKAEKQPERDMPQNCPICEAWCDDYRGHLKRVHNLTNRIFQCYKCRKFFKSFKSVISHMYAWNHTTNHCYQCEMEPPIIHPSQPRRHRCQFCKEWFPDHVAFKIHFKEAHNEDADFFFHKRKNCNCFTCYVCEREFPLRGYLAAHMKTHDDKFLQHQCPTCGRRVRTYGQLTQHLKTHEGKTFSCDQCDKKFPYYAKLRLHLHSHTTELNFMCDACPKAFKKRSYLKRHKAVHTNERRYQCKFCEASFNFTSARRAHEKSQHGAL